MGIRIYWKAGLKVIQNTQKKDHGSNSDKDRCKHTLEKELAYLTQCIATILKKRMLFFFCFIYIYIFFICTLASSGKYMLNLSFSVQTFFLN